MRYNKIATAFCAAALGLMALTSCEGGDLFSINAPDWLSSKADSIAAEKAKNQGDDVHRWCYRLLYRLVGSVL